MKVGELSQQNVITVSPTSGIAAAARVMREAHVGCLIVVEPGREEGSYKVVGVLTDRDIVVAVVARDADPRALTVGDVMTRDPLIANESSPLEVTLTLMEQAGVRRVPVVNSKGALSGVLSLDDALRTIAMQLTRIAGCIGSEQKVERHVRA